MSVCLPSKLIKRKQELIKLLDKNPRKTTLRRELNEINAEIDGKINSVLNESKPRETIQRKLNNF